MATWRSLRFNVRIETIFTMIISALEIISIAQLAFSTSSSGSNSSSSSSSTNSASSNSSSSSSSSSGSPSPSSSSSSSSQSSSSSKSSSSSSSSSSSNSSSSSSQSASSQSGTSNPKFADSNGNTVYFFEVLPAPNSDRPDLTFEVSQENITIEHRRNGVLADREVIKTRGVWNLIWHGLTEAQMQSLQAYTELAEFRFYPNGQEQTFRQVFCPQSNGWRTTVERGGTYTVNMLLRERDITQSSSSSSSSSNSSSSSSST